MILDNLKPYEYSIIDGYSSNKSINLRKTKTILQEEEIVMEVKDWMQAEGEAKFRFNTKEKINCLIDRLIELRDETFK